MVAHGQSHGLSLSSAAWATVPTGDLDLAEVTKRNKRDKIEQ
jgi:hypothetical protein